MHVGMNSSSDEDHDYSAVDDFIYKEFVEGSSDEDKLDDGDGSPPVRGFLPR